MTYIICVFSEEATQVEFEQRLEEQVKLSQNKHMLLAFKMIFLKFLLILIELNSNI